MFLSAMQSATQSSTKESPRRLAGALLCLLLSLAGCSGTQPPAALCGGGFSLENPARFGPRPGLPGLDEIYRLSPAQEASFLAYLRDPAHAATPAHQRLADYLEDWSLDFVYEGVTLPAARTFALGHGNCLSLAILTTALARVAEVEVGYQLMDDTPVFEFNGSVVQKGVHVRSILYDPGWSVPRDRSVFFRPGLKVDYFPTRNQRFIANLDPAEFDAMFYRNAAAAALLDGDLDAAYWHALESLEHAPDHPEALNLLAVVNRRAGDLAKAEAIYLYGIGEAEEKLSLLKNYRLLLEESGRHAEARAVQERLDAMADPSPFHWFHLARSSYQNQDYDEALRYYRKALELAPYLHESHLGMALVYFEEGKFSNAERQLRAAMEKAVKHSTRRLYQAKLEALTALAAQ